MNAYTLAIAPEALAEIRNIKFYLKYVLYSPKAADDFETDLYKKIDIILKAPQMYQSERIGKRYYRQAFVKKYVIIFYVSEASKTVHIIAVGHSRQRRSKLIKR